MRPKLRFLMLETLAVLALILLLPALALADSSPPPNHTLALPTDQIWVFVAASIVPFFTYLLNFRAPWLTEPVKAVVQVVVAAIAAAIVQAIAAGDVGFNQETLQFVITGVVGALLAHKWFWSPSGIALKAGAGRNIQTERGGAARAKV